MAIEIQFGAPGAAFLGKHGKLYCGICRKDGVRTVAELMPLGWPKSVVFKKEFACCASHLEAAAQAALARIRLDRDVSESEGEFQISQRFGV